MFDGGTEVKRANSGKPIVVDNTDESRGGELGLEGGWSQELTSRYHHWQLLGLNANLPRLGPWEGAGGIPPRTDGAWRGVIPRGQLEPIHGQAQRKQHDILLERWVLLQLHLWIR